MEKVEQVDQVDQTIEQENKEEESDVVTVSEQLFDENPYHAIESTAGKYFFLTHSKRTFADAILFADKFDHNPNRISPMVCVLDQSGLACTILADSGLCGIVMTLNSLYFNRWIIRDKTKHGIVFCVDAKEFAESIIAPAKQNVCTMALYDNGGQDEKQKGFVHQGHCLIKGPKGSVHTKTSLNVLKRQKMPSLPMFKARAHLYPVSVHVDSQWLDTACNNVAKQSKYVCIVLKLGIDSGTGSGSCIGVKGEHDTELREKLTLVDGQIVTHGSDWPSHTGSNSSGTVSETSVWITQQNAKRLSGMYKIHHAAQVFMHPTQPLIVSFLLAYHETDPQHPSRQDIWLATENQTMGTPQVRPETLFPLHESNGVDFAKRDWQSQL